MHYLIRLQRTRKLSLIEVIDAATSRVLTTHETTETAPNRVYKWRNQLFERLCDEAESVESTTVDWRN